MKKYLSFFKIRYKNSIQYRAAALAGAATQLFWGFMQILMFSAFYKENTNTFPMQFNELSSYIWLQQATVALFFLYMTDGTIFKDIMDGGVAYDLCRPIHIYDMWFTKNAALRLARTTVRCVPILIISLLLPKPYNLCLITNPKTIILFIISFILAIVLILALSMIVYALSFFTISSQGIRMFFMSITEFFSGAIVPIPFFPDKLRHIVELSPFGCLQNVPLRIYSGNIADGSAIKFIILQLFWTLVLIIVGRTLMSIGLKKVVVQGG